MKTVKQIVSLTYNDKRYFQCCGLHGYRIFIDVENKFKKIDTEGRNHDIMSAKSSFKFGYE